MLEWYWFPVDVLIPLGAAVLAGAIAGRYVSDQIAQLDRHRTADRRAKGIVELTSMIQADAEAVIAYVDAVEAYVAGGKVGTRPRLTALDRFRHNAHYVRGQSLLSEDSPAIANWVLQQSDELYSAAEAAWSAHGLTLGATGPTRAAAMESATVTTAALFAWQLGQRDTEWFVAEVKS